MDVNKTTTAYYFHRRHQLIYLHKRHLEMFDGEIEVDEPTLAEDAKVNVGAELAATYLFSGC